MRITGGLSTEFLKFWAGQSVSMLGNQFTQLALPIAAAVTLLPSILSPLRSLRAVPSHEPGS